MAVYNGPEPVCLPETLRISSRLFFELSVLSRCAGKKRRTQGRSRHGFLFGGGEAKTAVVPAGAEDGDSLDAGSIEVGRGAD